MSLVPFRRSPEPSVSLHCTGYLLSFFKLGYNTVTFTSVVSFRFENGGDFTSELEDGDDPAAYVTNLSYYHLVPFETDILD